MSDFEKVIKGLEYCSEKHNCIGCPYMKLDPSCQDDMNRDAKKLLTELIDELHYYEEWKEGYSKNQQQIVRCKDCKHGTSATYNIKEKRVISVDCDKAETHEPDWFCADGEMNE